MSNKYLRKSIIFLILAIIDNSIPAFGIQKSFSLSLFYFIYCLLHLKKEHHMYFWWGLLLDLISDYLLFGFYTLGFVLSYVLYNLFLYKMPEVISGLLIYLSFVLASFILSTSFSWLGILYAVVFYLTLYYGPKLRYLL